MTDNEMPKDEREKAVDDMEEAYLEIHDMIFSEEPIYPQADNFFLNHGHTLEAIVDEVRRWRKTHWGENPDGFRPDYCAARDALEEHLNTRAVPDKAALVEVRESLQHELNSWVGDEEIIAESVYEIALTGKTLLKLYDTLNTLIGGE